MTKGVIGLKQLLDAPTFPIQYTFFIDFFLFFYYAISIYNNCSTKETIFLIDIVCHQYSCFKLFYLIQIVGLFFIIP